MKLVSVQVGMPRKVTFRGRDVETGIFKSAVSGSVQVRKLNLEGDGQADLRVHGGPDKAVYAYPYDAYSVWKKRRPQDSFEMGAFGENLTLDPLDENEVCVGDTFQIGTAKLQAAQPRYPCFKLGVRFDDPSILKEFIEVDRPGVYFRVIDEGRVQAGDAAQLVARERVLLSIGDIFRFKRQSPTRERAQEWLQISSLTASFRREVEVFISGLPDV